jgi:acyl carrier protein
MMADRDDTRGRVVHIVSQIMGVPETSLDDRSSPDVIEAWDSLKHMNLVLALEEAFGIRFTDDEIMSMSSVAAIVAHVHERR